MNSTAIPSNCFAVGGQLSATGMCDCPSGLTSSYDAVMTGVYCTIPSEYSPDKENGTSNSDTAAITGDGMSVTLCGIVQLLIVYAACMVLVCVLRSLLSGCLKPDIRAEVVG